MILKRSELLMVRRGRGWFSTVSEPKVKDGQVLRLRSSRRDRGFQVTVQGVERDENGWRVRVRLGDCTEHPRFLAWTGTGASGESARGYTDDPRLAMLNEPEAVSDQWLNSFAKVAAIKEFRE